MKIFKFFPIWLGLWGFWILIFLAPQLAADSGRVIILADEIAAAKVTKIHEVLNRVPGVSASSSSVSIHGSYKVKVFLDGTTLTDPSSGYNAVTWDHLSPESVAKIEVVLGAGGLVYGQDATAGVILITSKELESLKGSLKVYGGDYGFFRTEADITVAKGLWGISARAGREEQGGYWPNEDKLIYRGGLKVVRRLTEGSIALGLSMLDDERGLYGYPGYPTPQARKHNRLFSLGQETKWKSLTNNFTYQRGRVANTDPSRSIDQYLLVTEASDDLTYSLNPASFVDLTFGAGLKKSWAESSDFTPKSEYFWHVFALAQARTPIEGLNFSLGARYNYNSNFRNNFNPEANVTFKRGAWSWGLKYSRSANTPSYQQRYNRSSSTIPNPSLDLEMSDNYSLSIDWLTSPNISFRLNAFYNRLSGRITYDRPASSGSGQYKNMGLATYEGADLGFDWKLSQILALKANVTYTRAKDHDLNKNITGRSRLAGSSELGIRPTKNFSAFLTIEYRTPSWGDRLNTSNIPGYALYSLRAELNHGPISFFFNLENALNRAWLYSDGLYGPPRDFYLGMAYRF